MNKVKKIAYGLYVLICSFLIIGLGLGIAWGMQKGVSKLPLRQYFPRSYTNAIWDWSNPANKSQHELDALSDFMYLHQLNTVYVNVGEYNPLLKNSKHSSKDAQKLAAYEKSLESYISALGKRNIKVYAAAGDVDWAYPAKRSMPLDVLYAVEQYNNSHQHARFTGVEFDVEAYNQPGFSDGSSTVKALGLGDFMDMVDKLATANTNYTKKTRETLELGFTIPYWFDNQNGNIPSITWHNKTGPVLYHLLDRLNNLKTSNVVVMAYRNAARGNDGSIALSRTEVEYAQAKAPRIKILIGQETTDVEPTKITYYGKNSTQLSNEVKYIVDAFGQTRVFDGIAINDLSGYQEMESAQ
jgi:hypothetical protein